MKAALFLSYKHSEGIMDGICSKMQASEMFSSRNGPMIHKLIVISMQEGLRKISSKEISLFFRMYRGLHILKTWKEDIKGSQVVVVCISRGSAASSTFNNTLTEPSCPSLESLTFPFDFSIPDNIFLRCAICSCLFFVCYSRALLRSGQRTFLWGHRECNQI